MVATAARLTAPHSTRVNYAQNLALVNGLISMVCMATDGAMSVDGGNWQIFAAMASAATRDIRLNTSVAALIKRSDSTYTLLPQNASTGALHETEHFDEVILAAPYQFSNLTLTPPPQHIPDPIPYVRLHVTLFTSPHRLSPAAFNLAPGAPVPRTILTTLAAGAPARGVNDTSAVGPAGFFSISTLRSVRNPATGAREHLYKVFSAAPVTGAFLGKILGVAGDSSDDDGEGATGEAVGKADVTWVYRKVWQSYPVELPRVTFEEVRLDEGLWYTSGVEGFISTMETSALAGKNVARLVVDGWVGGGNEGEGAVENEEEEGVKEL